MTASIARRVFRTAPRGAGFAVDLDRTLLPPGRPISKLARATIHDARAAGLRVVLVSGRGSRELVPLARALGPLDAVVAENGAVVEAPVGRPRTVIGRRTAHRVRRCLDTIPDLRVEYGEVVASVPWADRRRVVQHALGLGVRLERNVDRLMLLPAGVDKMTGLRLALYRLRVARGNFAAIGDGENDVPMLRGAALSGSVANATRLARAAADYHCQGRFERGVMEFLRGPVASWRGGPPRRP